MDHLITLTDDEELAVADLVYRAQDPKVTFRSQLEAIVHQTLAPIVAPLVVKQTDLVKRVMADVDAVTRYDISLALQLPTPLQRIDAMQTALAAEADRIRAAVKR